jgi:RNA polymerase sigma-70 factor (family 1)
MYKTNSSRANPPAHIFLKSFCANTLRRPPEDPRTLARRPGKQPFSAYFGGRIRVYWLMVVLSTGDGIHIDHSCTFDSRFTQVHFSEQDSWQLIRQGDKNAFEHAFRTWYKALCLYAMPIIRDKDEAEEVVQNVFYTIWAKRTGIDVTGPLKSYLYRAVHNECLNRLKHQKVKAAYAEDFRSVNRTAAVPAETLENKELGRQISEALESLPEQCGLVFRMNRFEHLKYSEIASRLNISVKTVESHMGKALKILRTKLSDYVHLLLWLIIFE